MCMKCHMGNQTRKKLRTWSTLPWGLWSLFIWIYVDLQVKHDWMVKCILCYSLIIILERNGLLLLNKKFMKEHNGPLWGGWFNGNK